MKRMRLSRMGSAQRRTLLVGTVVALTVAAVLVVYLERRSASLYQEQTARILQQVCERTATVLAGRLRWLLDAAVLETIEGIGHPQLLESDLPAVAALFAGGLLRHPYIDRFFLWSARQSSPLPDQVLFYSPEARDSGQLLPVRKSDGDHIGWLISEPPLGREILRLARDYSGQRTFVVLERQIGAVPYQIIIHLLWSDERRREVFAILGYTVNLSKLDGEMFHALLGTEIENVAGKDPGAPELVVSLFDETGRLVYGEEPIHGAAAAAPIEMLFFPGEPLKAWVAATPPVPVWKLMVTASAREPAVRTNKLLGAGVVLLILVAVFGAVTVERQAQRLSRMQSDFVANVSHQLKTPLSLLSAATETLALERVRSPEKLKEYIHIVRSQTARLNGLMDSILQFSRLGAVSYAYNLQAVDLAPLIASFVEQYKADSPDAELDLRFEARGPTRPVLVDVAALEQVLINLIENALKYGGTQNTIEVTLQQEEDETIIAVRDRGPGIHGDDLPHIFEKFYRGRHGPRPNGFGLGLPIVHGIVEAHGGRVTVHSEPSRGSEFRVHLPSKKEQRYGFPDTGR